MKELITFFSLLLLTASCGDPDSESIPVADFPLLNENKFIMKVDRIAESPEVHFPMDDLEESNYVLYNGDKNYTVEFSEEGQKVTLEPGSITGEKIDAEANSVRYELSGGVTAGGRFYVWINKDTFEAELTIYGSGIPIVVSERGKLLQ